MGFSLEAVFEALEEHIRHIEFVNDQRVGGLDQLEDFLVWSKKYAIECGAIKTDKEST